MKSRGQRVAALALASRSRHDASTALAYCKVVSKHASCTSSRVIQKPGHFKAQRTNYLQLVSSSQFFGTWLPSLPVLVLTETNSFK